MGTSIKPLIFKVVEERNDENKPVFIDRLRDEIIDKYQKDADILLEFPVIYIHVWQNRDDKLNERYSLYVGESENIIKRTTEHYRNAKIPADKRVKDSNWQFHMLEDLDDEGNPVVPTMYIIGHKLFNKSLTLSIENKVIDYCDAMVETAHPYNGRGNPQGEYSGKEYFDDIFSMIWRELHRDNPKLFLSESKIKKSAIYKSSPNHKLTLDQENAKAEIINKVMNVVLSESDLKNQFVLVEGEAGTGKTVLTSSTFYELINLDVIKDKKISCKLLINHDEQYANYQAMAKQLGINQDDVMNPTNFISTHSRFNPTTESFEPDELKIEDVVFIDEGHLLWTQPKQSFSKAYGFEQLLEIIKRSKVTVMMFDEYQVLRKEQFCEPSILQRIRDLAESQNNYIHLVNQLRMNCDSSTMNWIDEITKNQKVIQLSLDGGKDSKGYEVKIFDTPKELDDAILQKAHQEKTELSRLIATYDWKFDRENRAPEPNLYWEVSIPYEKNGNHFIWHKPWNEQYFHYTLEPLLNRRQKTKMKLLDWAEKEYSENEVGSTFTIQGFDLDYAGVILGPSVHFDSNLGKIVFLEEERAWDKMKGNRTLANGTKVNVTNTLSINELRVLLTRGTKGLYIYACDDALRRKLKESIQ